MNGADSNPNATTTPSPAPAAGDEERPGAWGAFVAAVRFLTRVRLSFAAPTTTAAFHASPVFFPLVGLLIATFTAVVAGTGALIWPVWLGAAVALAAEARLTGAFHEDALADFCDAFGGGWTREETLQILKDSRIGSYGALGLILGVTLRWVATAAVIEQVGVAHWIIWGSALVAAGGISRWAVLIGMAALAPVARRDSLSREIGTQTTHRQVFLGLLPILPAIGLFGWCLPRQCVFAGLGIAAGLPCLLRYVDRRIGGITGDCLGCIAYLVQVVVLLSAAARFPW